MTCKNCGKEKYPGERVACSQCGFCDQVRAWKVETPPEGGYLSYLDGYKYPYKGIPESRIIQNVAIMKRTLIVSLRVILKYPFIMCFPFVLFSRKTAKRLAIHWFASIVRTTIANLQDAGGVKYELLCRSGREIHRVFQEVLRDLPPEEEEDVKQCLIGVLLFWEMDNAYRYRGQDVLGSINKDALIDHPLRELLRLLNMASQRENNEHTKEYKKSHPIMAFDLKDKWRLLKIALIGFRIFFLKDFQSFVGYLLDLNIEEIKLDEGDWYFCCERFDYNFGGIPYLERLLIKKKEDDAWTQPVEEKKSEKANIALVPSPEFMNLSAEEAGKAFDELREKFFKDFESRKTAISPSSS